MPYIARWNGSAWSSFGTGLDAESKVLTVHSGELIAGGSFTTAGGQPSRYWARWGSQLAGDFDCGGEVGEGDYWYIHDGLGYCSPHQNYLDHNKADLDNDGAITLVDYQIWLECYREANGRDFVPPPGPRKAPPPVPASDVTETGPAVQPRQPRT